MPKKETLHFKTSSGIKSIVGRDLITDAYVAIFELVKNAYDAKAENVVVSINGTQDSGVSSSIVIQDDGIGMSKSDLQNKWLYLAYSDKKEGVQQSDIDTEINRVYVGSKGIGRFSCDRLGSHLEIITKKKDQDVEHALKVDWGLFDASLDELFERVEVQYTETANRTSDQFTKIVITGLRDKWSRKDIEKAVNQLKRLKNPFLQNDGFNIYCGENVFRFDEEISLAKVNQKYLVKNDIAEVLKGKTISIKAKISNEISIELFDRGKRIYQLKKDNDTLFQQLNIKIDIHYLTPSAKTTFRRRMGVRTKDYGNVFVYRNGFRVNPYGEVDYDFFGLNLRKGQGYSRNIGTREIIGHISILDPRNAFKETSSRDNGFIYNVYVASLEDFYMKYVHRALERYVLLVKWGEIKDTKEVVDWRSIQKTEAEKFRSSILRTTKVQEAEDYQLSYFSDDLSFEDNNPKNSLKSIAKDLPPQKKKKVDKVIKQYTALKNETSANEKTIANQKKSIDALERQNKNLINKRSEQSYGEQISHHFTVMHGTIHQCVKRLNKFSDKFTGSEYESFKGVLRRLKATEFELQNFKDLLLKTDDDMRSDKTFNWYDKTVWYVENLKSGTSGALNLICDIDNEEHITNWLISSNTLEFVMMLENFHNNAKEHRATFLDIQFTKSMITVSSNSVLIKDENRERIFDLGFSTKENGTGIGLDQIKYFLQKHGYGIRVENRNNMVCFIIEGEKCD